MGEIKLWTKRYGEDEEFRYIDSLCEMSKASGEKYCPPLDGDSGTDHLERFSASITRVEDKAKLAKADDYISKAKRYSLKHRVSADIFKSPSGISVWLYFTADALSGSRKNELSALIARADELTAIPHPIGMPEWCELAVVLNYRTHRCYVDGRELYINPRA